MSHNINTRHLARKQCCEGCGRPYVTPAKHGISFHGGWLYVGDSEVKITLTERGILEFMAARLGAIVHEDRLFSAVWGGLEVHQKIVQVYICKIRKKLLDTPLEIRTSHGQGFGLYFRAGFVGNSERTKPNAETTTHVD
jgi:DNA-binding winged helix-turn-helix (wHTH) protein